MGSIHACSKARNASPVSNGQQREGFQAMFPPDNIAGRFYSDPAKALVMAHIGQFVCDGYAEWTMLDNGDVELRFFSGEVNPSHRFGSRGDECWRSTTPAASGIWRCQKRRRRVP
jgi:hypothetical protein